MALLVQLSQCLVQFHFIVLLLIISLVPTLQQTIQDSIVLICAAVGTQERFKLSPHYAVLFLPST
jgi:hypothetical protein